MDDKPTEFNKESAVNPAPFIPEQLDDGKADQMQPLDEKIPISQLEDTLSQKWWFNSLPDNTPYKKMLEEFYTGSANGLNAQMDYNKIIEDFKGIANATNLIFNGAKSVMGTVVPDPMKSACYDFSDIRKIPGLKTCTPKFPDNSQKIAEIEAQIATASGEEIPKIRLEWDKWKEAYNQFDGAIDARLAQIDNVPAVKAAWDSFVGVINSTIPDIDLEPGGEVITDNQFEQKIAEMQSAISSQMDSAMEAYQTAVNAAMDAAAMDLAGQAQNIMLNLMADSQAMEAAEQGIEEAQDEILKLTPPVPSQIFKEMMESGAPPEMAEPLEMPIPSLLGKNKIDWWLWLMDKLIKNLRTKLLQELIYKQIIKPLIECGKLMVKLAQDMIRAAKAGLKIIRGVVRIILGINAVIAGFQLTIEGAAEIASAGTDPFTAVPKIVDGGLKVENGLKQIKTGFEEIKGGFNDIKTGFKDLVNAFKDAFTHALKIGRILIKLHLSLAPLFKIQWIRPLLENPIIPGDFPLAGLVQTFLDPSLVKTDDEQKEAIDLPEPPMPPPVPQMQNMVMDVLRNVMAGTITQMVKKYGIDKLYDILPNQGIS